jgi:hypothetical protein
MSEHQEIQHPDLAEALASLAESLDRRHVRAPDAPSYLEMAVLADHISQQLTELTRMLINAARAQENAKWSTVGDAFGVTRQAAMRRWTA